MGLHFLLIIIYFFFFQENYSMLFIEKTSLTYLFPFTLYSTVKNFLGGYIFLKILGVTLLY